ncbi:tRNA (adenosine(37)-N6)-threonylcarbamoyltransferase complex transferase subunit TsaD [Candidatus Finniella inopinata]|uniref:tRNA N6-adenosine threonylcarbamoyltransferase n=1 Tax=Candidatus Finniella inopinata TaxID=1696036 RepID=A0A4Q7DH25_9PROT|nr:tRNA (adenosine(37)-N6)-threonylcarbamoyltransferase complex transferase subunit TsaD [Candidatus Finniella inopinata]RZI46221.1 tRNA (adenosine(37)-N6)-threonylcarbamoyltransferase complex transferase subunit TsaD [Candidatus Finniella inopinata]
MKILGIETSCDETAVAIVQAHADPAQRILANVVFSQIEQHQDYGGVVPELAARAHLEYLSPTLQQALKHAHLSLEDMDAIAVTAGPGLIGGVLVGLMTAKALAMALRKPFLAINHLEGHALTPRLSHDVPFPYLLLLVSGGHCQFVEVQSLGRYRVLGSTIDDAAGEAFDKVAQLMNFDYPGGPALEKAAQQGNPKRFDLPRPLKGRPGCDLSFSGLKTAARMVFQNFPHPTPQDINDIAATFQLAVVDSLINRAEHAIQMLSAPVDHFVVAGGVAANQTLRGQLSTLCGRQGLTFVAPPISLCTDNAAMIAWAGLERFSLGYTSDLGIGPRPRWPLTDL